MMSDGGALFNDPTTTYDHYFVPQGIAADLVATIEGFNREDVDAYAVRSQQRAEVAWTEGRFKRSIVPVTDMNGVTILDLLFNTGPNAPAYMKSFSSQAVAS